MTREGLATNAALYPWRLDLAHDAVQFVPMRAEDYRRSSFLDERVAAHGPPGAWERLTWVSEALAGARDIRPLHFIFHSGHVGSTLLSRLLDEMGSVLSLREPLPLRSLAEAYDHEVPGLDARLEIFLRLWERGFAQSDVVILKATSTAQRLAPRLLAARPESCAITLNVGAETYIATMFAAQNSIQDLNGYGPERLYRLSVFLGEAVRRPSSLGELAAMAWLVEKLTQTRLQDAFGARVMALDFDAMLAAIEDGFGKVLLHLGLDARNARHIAGSDALRRYAKAPEHEYSPSLRSSLLREARDAYPSELHQAMEWLFALGRRYRQVAAIL
ncbi:MAG: hypothetical protein JWN58_1156 [Gammaproteobacteria bacterium]|nr:hypothetical protein [Gammaproteobacteria bacterium]